MVGLSAPLYNGSSSGFLIGTVICFGISVDDIPDWIVDITTEIQVFADDTKYGIE